MNSKIIETLETLEDRIENIKWLITTQLSLKRAGISSVINTIRRSSGILGKNFPKGTVFENKIRKEWKTNYSKRIS